MGEVAPGQPIGTRTPPAQAAGAHNGLAEHVAAVQEARLRLGRDLDRLTVEARAQMGQTMEKIAWKLAAAGAGVAAGLAVRKAMAAAPGTSWAPALAWTLAMAAGMGAAKLVAIRGVAAGWQKATGTLPPGLEEPMA